MAVERDERQERERSKAVDLADGELHGLRAFAFLTFVSFNCHVIRSSDAWLF